MDSNPQDEFRSKEDTTKTLIFSFSVFIGKCVKMSKSLRSSSGREARANKGKSKNRQQNYLTKFFLKHRGRYNFVHCYFAQSLLAKKSILLNKNKKLTNFRCICLNFLQ